MNRVIRYTSAVSLFFFAASLAAHNPLDMQALSAEYPLRVHIYSKHSVQVYTPHKMGRTAASGSHSVGAHGRGSANLFEASEPRGFDFTFDCADNFIVQRGGDTYPARWIKKDKQLEISVGYFGDKNRVLHCTLKTEMQGYAYHKHNGHIATIPIAERQKWMKDHDYDPEHGKNEIKDKQE